MKQVDINKTRGHALYLKNIFTTALGKCDALVTMADILDSSQVITMNLRILDLVCKSEKMLVEFDLLKEETHED